MHMHRIWGTCAMLILALALRDQMSPSMEAWSQACRGPLLA